MPDPVRCPEGEARKSVAIYYMSDARPEATPRYKASYRPRPGSLHPTGNVSTCMHYVYIYIYIYTSRVNAWRCVWGGRGGGEDEDL